MMKRKIILSLMATFLLSLATVWATVDFSYTGWTASTGTNTWVGKAKNVTKMSGTWSFYCIGSGTCYYIDGGWLYIYDAIPPYEPGGDYIEVWESD